MPDERALFLRDSTMRGYFDGKLFFVTLNDSGITEARKVAEWPSVNVRVIPCTFVLYVVYSSDSDTMNFCLRKFIL